MAAARVWKRDFDLLSAEIRNRRITGEEMEKGTRGYIDTYKKRYGLYSLILAVLIFAGAVAVYLIFGTLKHAAVLLPIILALPFAKLLLLWVVVVRFHSLKQEDGMQLESRLEGRKNCILLFDLALSSYDAISFAPAAVIDQGNVYLLWGGSNEKNYGQEQQKEYVQDIMKRTGYQDAVYTTEGVEALLEQIEAAPVSEADLSVKCDRLRQRLLDVCV